MHAAHAFPKLLFLAALLAASGCRDRAHRDDMPMSHAGDATSSTGAAHDTGMGDAPSAANRDERREAPPATSQSATPGGFDSDRDFVRTALSSGLAEASLSRYVQTQSPTREVRALAKRIADDHDALNAKLRGIQGVGAESVGIDPAAKSMDAAIRAKRGTALDQAYLQHMSDGHRNSIARFESAATGASTDALRRLASDALPTLRDHAQSVDALLGAPR